jgi:hypothetical protein
MLSHFVKDNKVVRNTGLSFAIAGTGMHFLNIASATTPQVSHAWSAIAITGFFLTSMSQLKESKFSKFARKLRRRDGNAIHPHARNDDVPLP